MPHKDPMKRQEYEKRRSQDPKRKLKEKERTKKRSHTTEWKRYHKEYRLKCLSEGVCPRHPNEKRPLAVSYNGQSIKLCKECADKSYALHNKSKIDVMNHYGTSCKMCGELLFEFLTIDHIDGGGKKHRKIVGYGQMFYKWLIRNNYPSGYQTLCFNCNCGRKQPRNPESPKCQRKLKILTHYGLACACCGEKDLTCLSIDHVKGGGNQHRKDIGGDFYCWLIRNNFPEDFRTLCFNCNNATKYGKLCPHQHN